MRKAIMLCLVVWAQYVSAQQADSIRLTLGQAEEIFLQKNLLLLAAKYQADAVRANEIQQKLYNNPSISTEFAAWGENKKWLDIGSTGQKMFSIDQLILLAGKRKKRVALAKEQTLESEFTFYDLMRNLKYELRNSFYTLSYANDLIKQYDEQMRMLQQIINAYDEQAAKRNVSLKDAIRLKAEYIQLSSDRNSTIMEAVNARQTLQLLLDTTAVISPVTNEFNQKVLPDLNTLLSKAFINRPDLKLQASRLKQDQLNYDLQKAMAKPDIILGAGYDQRGSYINNLYTFRAAIDLPLFNKNQGNIKSAKAMIESSSYAVQYKQKEIEKEIIASIARLQEAEREYRESQNSFNKDFLIVNRSVIENFNKGNISILEFLDFFENYNLAIRQINQLEKQRRMAWEDIEYSVGGKLNN